jgi:hypothetical protein
VRAVQSENLRHLRADQRADEKLSAGNHRHCS